MSEFSAYKKLKIIKDKKLRFLDKLCNCSITPSIFLLSTKKTDENTSLELKLVIEEVEFASGKSNR